MFSFIYLSFYPCWALKGRNQVKTTNFCDITPHSNGRQIAVFSSIDNLVKGATGQAVQNMNLMFGLEKQTGLVLVGTNP